MQLSRVTAPPPDAAFAPSSIVFASTFGATAAFTLPRAQPFCHGGSQDAYRIRAPPRTPPLLGSGARSSTLVRRRQHLDRGGHLIISRHRRPRRAASAPFAQRLGLRHCQ